MTPASSPYSSLSPWERAGVRAGAGAPRALTLTLSQGERGQDR